MRKANFILFAVLICCFATMASAQLTLPGKKRVRPDLKVSDVQISAVDGFAKKITITVQNGCVAAPESYVLATFRTNDGPNGQAIFYIGNTVKALNIGETYTQTFDIADKNLGAGRFVIVEVDPYKKVVEDDENNNWRKLNPGSSPSPNANPCQPK